MPATSDRPPAAATKLITFRGGFAARWPVVARLLDLEARGATFRLLDAGRFRVEPTSILTAEDVAFLRAHRDEARACIAYVGHASEAPQ